MSEPRKKEDLKVGQRFRTVRDYGIQGLLDKTGTVTRVFEHNGHTLFDIHLDSYHDVESENIPYIEKNWNISFWTNTKGGPFEWLESCFDHDWQAAADNRRDRIFRHLFRDGTAQKTDFPEKSSEAPPYLPRYLDPDDFDS